MQGVSHTLSPALSQKIVFWHEDGGVISFQLRQTKQHMELIPCLSFAVKCDEIVANFLYLRLCAKANNNIYFICTQTRNIIYVCRFMQVLTLLCKDQHK